MPPWLLRVIRIVRPCIEPRGARMADQIEYFYNTVPYRAALEHFLDWYAFHVLRLDAVQLSDYVAQLVDIRHAAFAASTSSPTLQNDGSTPAAIAGVQRIVR